MHNIITPEHKLPKTNIPSCLGDSPNLSPLCLQYSTIPDCLTEQAGRGWVSHFFARRWPVHAVHSITNIYSLETANEREWGRIRENCMNCWTQKLHELLNTDIASCDIVINVLFTLSKCRFTCCKSGLDMSLGFQSINQPVVLSDVNRSTNALCYHLDSCDCNQSTKNQKFNCHLLVSSLVKMASTLSTRSWAERLSLIEDGIQPIP